MSPEIFVYFYMHYYENGARKLKAAVVAKAKLDQIKIMKQITWI